MNKHTIKRVAALVVIALALSAVVDPIVALVVTVAIALGLSRTDKWIHKQCDPNSERDDE